MTNSTRISPVLWTAAAIFFAVGCSTDLSDPKGFCDDGKCDEGGGDYYQDETLLITASSGSPSGSDHNFEHSGTCRSPNGCILTMSLDLSVAYGSPYYTVQVHSGSRTLWDEYAQDGRTLVSSVLPGEGYRIQVDAFSEDPSDMNMRGNIQVRGSASLTGALCLVEKHDVFRETPTAIPLGVSERHLMTPFGRTSLMTGYTDGWFADDPLQFTLISDVDMDLLVSPLYEGAGACEAMLALTSSEGTTSGGTVEALLAAGTSVSADITLPSECDGYWDDSASAGLALEMTDLVKGQCPVLTVAAMQ